jgi:hypothetical protein
MTFKEFYKQSEKDKYDQYVTELSEAASRANIVLRTLGTVKDYDLYRLTINPGKAPTILIGATMHGDEPAGAYAVIEYLKEQRFPTKTRLIILPCMNPHGFATEERWALGGRDLNRQWRKKELKEEAQLIYDTLKGERIDFFLSLHEDDTAKGFYIYASDKKLKKKWEPMIEMAEKIMKINTQKTIYGQRTDEKGIILVDKENNKEARHDTSIESWVYRTHRANYLCTETPSSLPMKWRVRLYKNFIDYVAKNVLKEE